MAHGINTSVKRGASGLVCKTEGKAGMGSRRIFAPQFKLQVLDSYRNDVDCKGNQRATARKYGIHRRQIQKWLQVENNLRNSVIKSKTEVAASSSPEARKCGFELALRSCDQLRQRDDVSVEAYGGQQRQQETGAELELASGRLIGCAEADKRVPEQGAHVTGAHVAGAHDASLDRRVPEMAWHGTMSPTYAAAMVAAAAPSPELSLYKCECPLDYTVRRESSDHLAPAPMDLSVRRCARPRPLTPVSVRPAATAPLSIQPDHPLPPAPCASPDPLIWDLSTKGTKRQRDDSPARPLVTSSADVKPETEPKPVKLFKPYLLDDDNSSSSDNKCVESPYLDYGYGNNRIMESEYYYNNNNEYFYKDDPYKSYYYPISPDYYSGNVQYIDDKNDYFKKNSNLIKQRQSYSLDFKLSAIQCYYSDEICKGNQRAVASKYNIHRRQVQKWLKQEDELRQRIETTKHMHIVI